MVSTFSAGRKEASSSQESIQRHHIVGLQLEIVILGALLAAAAGTHDPVSQPSCSTEQVDALTTSLYSRLGKKPHLWGHIRRERGTRLLLVPQPSAKHGCEAHTVAMKAANSGQLCAEPKGDLNTPSR